MEKSINYNYKDKTIAILMLNLPVDILNLVIPNPSTHKTDKFWGDSIYIKSQEAQRRIDILNRNGTKKHMLIKYEKRVCPLFGKPHNKKIKSKNYFGEQSTRANLEMFLTSLLSKQHTGISISKSKIQINQATFEFYTLKNCFYNTALKIVLIIPLYCSEVNVKRRKMQHDNNDNEKKFELSFWILNLLHGARSQLITQAESSRQRREVFTLYNFKSKIHAVCVEVILYQFCGYLFCIYMSFFVRVMVLEGHYVILSVS